MVIWPDASSADEIGGLATQQQMVSRVYREVMRDMAPSMEANDAMIGGRR